MWYSGLNVKLMVECEILGRIWNSESNVKIRVECEIQSRMWKSELNVKFRVECKIHAPIWSYCPKYKIIVPNVKLLSAECECESECDGNFYMAKQRRVELFERFAEWVNTSEPPKLERFSLVASGNIPL